MAVRHWKEEKKRHEEVLCYRRWESYTDTLAKAPVGSRADRLPTYQLSAGAALPSLC